MCWTNIDSLTSECEIGWFLSLSSADLIVLTNKARSKSPGLGMNVTNPLSTQGTIAMSWNSTLRVSSIHSSG